MAIIDERFRKMLMMDYATKEGQNNQGFFGSNLTGGLLSNINPTLLIGADLIGSGVKGKDPFSSLVPALLKTPVLSWPDEDNLSTINIFMSGKISDINKARVELIIPAPTKTASYLFSFFE